MLCNKWLKRDMHQIVYIIYDEHGPETFRATRNEICLIVIYLQQNWIEICQETDLWQVMKFI
jgi:hypothetical protein